VRPAAIVEGAPRGRCRRLYFTSESSAALENRGVPHLPIDPTLVEWLQAPPLQRPDTS